MGIPYEDVLASDLRDAEIALEAAEARAERLASMLKEAEKAVRRAEKALRPFATRVLNDNGDLTINTEQVPTNDFADDYFAHKSLVARLEAIEATAPVDQSPVHLGDQSQGDSQC